MNLISRRQALRHGASAAASMALLGALPMRLSARSLAKSAGIQLYTVGKELAADMQGTLDKLAAIGRMAGNSYTRTKDRFDMIRPA